MKKIIFMALVLAFVAGNAHAQRSFSFFGSNNFGIFMDTTFSADLNNGATGLMSSLGFDLWFEFLPYQDRNIVPQTDILSVSLRLANSAIYAWRGYDFTLGDIGYGHRPPTLWGNPDQAKSIWFDNFLAQLEYGRFWVRIAGIEPEVTLSQASIRSVFDPVFDDRTSSDNNMRLPLFSSSNQWATSYGIVSVIGRDLVNLNRQEVQIAGNLSAGMQTTDLDLTLKLGSWRSGLRPEDQVPEGPQNTANSWVFGAAANLRPNFTSFISLSLMGAVNYGEVDTEDPMANRLALSENPLAFGIGYDHRISLPRNMVLRPYVGFDFIYEFVNNNHDWEVGAGLQFFPRGTGAQQNRDSNIGGVAIGDHDIPIALMVGFNMDSHGIVNGIVSFNEDPRSSRIPNLGGFLLMELMNIGGREFAAANGVTYNDFLIATMFQIEYIATSWAMPYVFFRYMPAHLPRGDLRADDQVFGRELMTLTSRVGTRFTPFPRFFIDVWYERWDFGTLNNGTWNFEQDNGVLSVMFGIRLND